MADAVIGDVTPARLLADTRKRNLELLVSNNEYLERARNAETRMERMKEEWQTMLETSTRYREEKNAAEAKVAQLEAAIEKWADENHELRQDRDKLRNELAGRGL